MLGSLILYLKGTRIVMFQLSGFYYNRVGMKGFGIRIRGLGFRVPRGLAWKVLAHGYSNPSALNLLGCITREPRILGIGFGDDYTIIIGRGKPGWPPRCCKRSFPLFIIKVNHTGIRL